MPAFIGNRTVAGLLAAAAVAAGFAARAPAPTATGPARSRPGSRPAPDPERLADDCRRAAGAMLARLDESFRAVVRPPFVVVGNLSEARLRRVADGSVVAPAKAMWASYFRRRPTDVITALLFKDDKTYRHWARRLFNDTDLPHFGYCRTARRTMVMNIGTGTGTLVHELTHALIVYDFPDVPTWFNEGLASLHEQCYVRADGIVGCVNWRLPALQRAIRGKTLRPLSELVTAGGFYGRGAGLNYAQARYFCMYMQQRGLLKRFYALFRDRRGRADRAVRTIEEVFADELDDVDRAFAKWVLTLRWPE